MKETEKTMKNEEENNDEGIIPVKPGKPLPLGKKPEYVIQPNPVSQGIYDISVMARRLVAMTMALIPPDFSVRTAHFTIDDFCKALGLNRGGMTDDSIAKALEECMKETSVIKFKEIENGYPIYKLFMFFTKAEMNVKTNIISVKFNDDLANYLLSLQKMFAKIPLEDFGKLSSKYAIRYFEMALSYKGFEGKNGNKKNSWWFEVSIDELKEALQIKGDEYDRMGNFKKRIIEDPIKEINNANIGMEITAKYGRTGKFLTSTIFNIKYEEKMAKPKKTRKTIKVNTEIQESKDTIEDKEIKKLKKLYPEDYIVYFEEYVKNNNYLTDGTATKKAGIAYACKKLKEKYGIRK